MTFDQLISHYGTQARAARALNLSQASVCGWRRKGIPLLRQAQYEEITGRVLKSDPLVAKFIGAVP